MNRRILLFASALAGLALPALAWPQPAGRTARVGFVLTTSPVSEMVGAEPQHTVIRDFLHGMRRLGYVEGRNFVLERRSAEGKFERFGEIISELLRLKPDAIVTIGIPLTVAAKKLTASVPIVFVISGGGDPVAAGIVQSLSRPGGNVTGFLEDAGPEIFGKRLQLLKETVPAIRRVAFLGLRGEWETPHARSARAAAEALGIAMFLAEASADDYVKAFEIVRRERADAIFGGGHPVHFVNRQKLVDFAAQARLPDAHYYAAGTDSGGLLSYAAVDIWPQLPGYIAKIITGTRPGELPVQQPVKFELAVNLKAARVRGLSIAQSVLLRADRVIE